MTPEPGYAHPWPALRQLPGRTPLHVKLIAAVLALVAIALIVIGITSTSVLSGYLQGRADSEVVAEYRQLTQDHASHMPMEGGFSAINGFPYITEIRNSSGFILTQAGLVRPSSHEPAVPTSAAWLQANAGHLVTIASFSGRDDWRVITRQISYQVFDQETGSVITTTGTLIVGADLGDINGTTHHLANIDLIVSLILLLALAIAGVAVVRASLLPLAEIEQTAAAIASGDLTRRVPERDPRTEVGRLGRSLNWMLGQIETAFRARSESEAAARRSEERMRQFVADASHELRTPLTAIGGYAEYYRQRLNQKGEATSGANVAATEKSLSSDPEESLTRTDLAWIMQRIEQESLRMRGLVEDLLLLARLDEQRPIERRPVDLLTLAADAVKDARVIAPNRQINLAVKIGVAPLVLGDEGQLRQVIGNLMGNALTHTPDRTPITLELSEAALGSLPAVALDVADQGPGLPPDQQGRIFERFYRADQARARKTGGAGLGLSIVAALVAAHGGSVTVSSTPGQGATFRVMLPLAPDVIGIDP